MATVSSIVPNGSKSDRLVIAHFVAAALCFVTLTVMLLGSSDVLLGHYFHPRLLAITHMAALGWGSLTIIGTCYQLIPYILEVKWYSFKTAWLTFSLFMVGLLLMVYAFWIFDPGVLMQAGSLMLVSAIALFGINTTLTARQDRREDICREFIVTACLWLFFTALLGALLVFNFRYAFLPKDHLQFLKLHAHMGLGGWFLLLVIGVSSRLAPMFLISSCKSTALISWSYYLINAALLLFLIDTYLFGINMKTYFFGFMAMAGIATYIVFIAKCFRTRSSSTVDAAMVHFAISVCVLVLAVLLVPLIIFYQLKGDPGAVRYTTIYGCLLFMGWVSALILGKTFKILPYILWARHYQRNLVSVVPKPAELFRKHILTGQLSAFLIFLGSFFAGLLLDSAWLINFGLFCFLFTAVLYLTNVMITVLHRPKIIHEKA